MNSSELYESLVGPHLDDLRNYCFYLTRSKWDGEDLYQESLLKTMVYFLHTDPRQDLKHFLFRVARNLWIDGCRTAERRRNKPNRDAVFFHRDSNYAEVRGLVEWLSQQLPRRNVEMWLLSEYFQYSMQEMADLLNCTVPAVKSVLHRTRELLRGLKSEKDKEHPGLRSLRLDVETWSRAIMHDLPPCL
jgi:RNA polymerase sigma-70 factor (ECF subfamily)